MSIARKAALLLTAFLLTSTAALHAKDAEYYNELDLTVSQKIRQNLFFTSGAFVILSTDSNHYSPINFSLGAGYSQRIVPGVYIEPRLAVFYNYYSWDNDSLKATPAEAENRTAATINLVLDIPVMAKITLGRNTFHVGGGIGLVPKISFLAGNVSSDDWGTSGTAASDLNNINSYLWGSLRWIYPELAAAYTYSFENGWTVGIDFRYYLPMTSLVTGLWFDGSLANIGLRLSMPIK